MTSGGILNLNVGGIVYTTTWETVKNSKLPSMFSGKDEITNSKDSKGNYFIDRDGSLFRHVLYFLRTRKLCLPQSFDEFEQLSEEADFYQVDGLVNAIQTRIQTTSEDPGVIIIIAHEANLFVSGKEKFLKEVFSYGYTNATGFQKHNGYELACAIKVISKENAFESLYKAGFQLEGCNRGGDAAVGYDEYIFVRKN